MLTVEGLEAGYGESQVLFGVGFTIGAGEAVSLLGRNGMGKTTTVKAVMGLLPRRAGSVAIGGRPMPPLAPHLAARAGIGLVPEGRQVFPTLTVEENLVATARRRGGGGAAGRWPKERIYGLFPQLEAKRRALGSALSGGEQQMLAIGRALATEPRLLILDEATEGLAPLVRHEIWSSLALLKSEGVAILVIDRNLKDLERLADRHLVIEKGRIVWQGDSARLHADRDRIEGWLGV